MDLLGELPRWLSFFHFYRFAFSPLSEEEDDDEQKEPMLKESFGKRKKNFHSISVLKTALWRKVSCSVAETAADRRSSRGNAAFMFGIYTACLILGFSVDTEYTAIAVVALPCPVDFVWLNMS